MKNNKGKIKTFLSKEAAKNIKRMTYEEFLQHLPPDIRKKFNYNFEKYNYNPTKERKEIKSYLVWQQTGFSWFDAPEGFVYWSDFYFKRNMKNVLFLVS